MNSPALAAAPQTDQADVPANDTTTRTFELTYHDGNRAAVDAILRTIADEGGRVADEQELSRTVEMQVSIDSARYSDLITKVLEQSADSGVQFRREIPAA